MVRQWQFFGRLRIAVGSSHGNGCVKSSTRKPLREGIRLLAEACSPAKVKELLSKEFNETLSNCMKVAIVTSMLPSSIQDCIYTSMDGEIAYDAFIAKDPCRGRKQGCHDGQADTHGHRVRKPLMTVEKTTARRTFTMLSARHTVLQL